MISGFVSVVGRPNVGKSTLVNALVGTKVAISSPRPQTTRNTIRGVLTLDEPARQFVFVDTPGLHKPRTALGERLNRLVYGSIADADAVVFVLDVTQQIGPGDRRIATRLAETSTPVIIVVSKVDLATPGQIATHLDIASEWAFTAYVPVAAIEGDGVSAVIEELTGVLHEGPAFFPADVATDQPDSLLAAELVREQYLAVLRDELPHSLAVVVDALEVRDSGTLFVPATVYVERNSQKGIVIGKGGELLRSVGERARLEMESFFGMPVYLELRVVVERNWQRRDESLNRLGF